MVLHALALLLAVLLVWVYSKLNLDEQNRSLPVEVVRFDVEGGGGGNPKGEGDGPGVGQKVPRWNKAAMTSRTRPSATAVAAEPASGPDE